LKDNTKYFSMRNRALATWIGKPLYSESVIQACKELLERSAESSKVLFAKNYDSKTIDNFGDEWIRFDQSGMSDAESCKLFNQYFAVFPWHSLPSGAEGFDMGCGSGRWARWVAPRVGRLHCIDPSDAIDVASNKLAHCSNVVFHRTSVDASGLPLSSQDFGYSLGVLHHVPDTAAAIRSCVELLKPGAPLLLYLYYAFDERPWWFKAMWRASDFGRKIIWQLSPGLKNLVTDLVALWIYWPIAKVSLVLEWFGFPVGNVPLSFYRNHTFYVMRTDARDRFGTPLEHRFTKSQIKAMMEQAGLVGIKFSDRAPFWCAVGVRR
jgi:SAM-dependent methyltransferase